MTDYVDSTMDRMLHCCNSELDPILLEVFRKYKKEMRRRGIKQRIGLDAFDFVYRSGIMTGMVLEHEILTGEEVLEHNDGPAIR